MIIPWKKNYISTPFSSFQLPHFSNLLICHLRYYFIHWSPQNVFGTYKIHETSLITHPCKEVKLTWDRPPLSLQGDSEERNAARSRQSVLNRPGPASPTAWKPACSPAEAPGPAAPHGAEASPAAPEPRPAGRPRLSPRPPGPARAAPQRRAPPAGAEVGRGSRSGGAGGRAAAPAGRREAASGNGGSRGPVGSEGRLWLRPGQGRHSPAFLILRF